MSDPQQFPPASGMPPASASAQPAAPAAPPYGAAPQTSPASPQPYPAGTAQVGYPAAGAAQTGYPGAAAARGSDGLARVALVLAIVSVALGVLYTVLFRFVIIRLSYDMHLGASAMTAYNLVGQVLLFLSYGVTLVLGILSVRSSRKVLAGIAIGVGGAGLIGIAFALLSNVIPTSF